MPSVSLRTAPISVGIACWRNGSRCCGNSRVGDHVWVGVGAIVSNRVRVGDGARVSLGSVVTKEVPAGQTVSGNFAIDHQKFLSNLKKSLEE